MEVLCLELQKDEERGFRWVGEGKGKTRAGRSGNEPPDCRGN